jgi:hypothetical protein
MVILGWLVRRYVAQNLQGGSNNQQRKADLQRRLTRILVIQV